MPKRTWEAKTKALIVIEGLKGKPGAEICHEPQRRQAQYYQWREQFLAHAPKAFEGPEPSRKETRLEQENVRLKTLVGEWLLERKNSAAVSG
jgi:transposase-like protein